jgi:hypothetical protein
MTLDPDQAFAHHPAREADLPGKTTCFETSNRAGNILTHF